MANECKPYIISVIGINGVSKTGGTASERRGKIINDIFCGLIQSDYGNIGFVGNKYKNK